jgi:hypothetical protein
MKQIEATVRRWGIFPIILAIVSFAISIVFDKALVLSSSPAGEILRGAVVAVITYLVVANIELLQKVKYNLENDDINKITHIRQHIDRQFLEIFDEYFDSVLENINSAIKHKKITIYTVDQFRDFYIRILRNCPDTTFYATSSFHPNYFWKEDVKKDAVEVPAAELSNEDFKKGTVEFATKEFTKKAGPDKFIRIFLISDSDKQKPERIQKVLEIQKRMGVTALCLELADADVDEKRHHRFILAAENEKFAWEVHTGGDYYISKVEITVDDNEVDQLLKIINEIRNMNPKPADQYLRELKRP